ncbi:MAG: hypothetical protein OEZ02_00895 [Anaerolineae bacterium]|nr:hypothetical protein [Anaerolineae bacterium]
MTTLDEMFPKPHLRAYDLQGQPRTVTIKTVVQKPLWDQSEQRKIPKWVVYFSEYPKYFILNETTAETIADLTGSRKLAEWIGKQVEIYPTTEKAFGEVWDVVRVSKGTQPATASQPSKPTLPSSPTNGQAQGAAFSWTDEDRPKATNDYTAYYAFAKQYIGMDEAKAKLEGSVMDAQKAFDSVVSMLEANPPPA